MHETNGAAPAPTPTRGQGPGLMALGGEIEQVMGHLVFYSVPEAWIAHDRLEAVWRSEGLDPGLVPPPPGAAGVFQAACRSLEARRTGEAGRVEIRVAQVLATPEECVCQVNWQVRDAAVRLVEHPKALRLTLERLTERIVAERLGPQSVVRDADGCEVALPDPDEMTARVARVLRAKPRLRARRDPAPARARPAPAARGRGGARVGRRLLCPPPGAGDA